MKKEIMLELSKKIKTTALKMDTRDIENVSVDLSIQELERFFPKVYQKNIKDKDVNLVNNNVSFVFCVPDKDFKKHDFSFSLVFKEKSKAFEYHESCLWKEDVTETIKDSLQEDYLYFCRRVFGIYKQWKNDLFFELMSKITKHNIVARGTYDNMVYVTIPSNYLMSLFPTLINQEDCDENCSTCFCFGVPHEDYNDYSFGIEFDEEFFPLNKFFQYGTNKEYEYFCSYVQEVFDEKYEIDFSKKEILPEENLLRKESLFKLISTITKDRIVNGRVFEDLIRVPLSKEELEEIFLDYVDMNEIKKVNEVNFCFVEPDEYDNMQNKPLCSFYLMLDNNFVDIETFFGKSNINKEILYAHLSKVYFNCKQENKTIDEEGRIELANKRIEELVDKVISLRMKLMNGQCIHPTYQYPITPQEKEKNKEFCVNQNCEACREEYTSGIRKSMIETYRV